MKKITLLALSIAITGMVVMVQCQKKADTDMTASTDIVSSMEQFHTLLRPLQHQAVPSNDIQAIKTSAGELETLAQQIQDSSLPESLEEHKQQIDEFTGKLLEASKSLKDSAETLSDEEILVKFASIHDHYEELADVIYKLDNMH